MAVDPIRRLEAVDPVHPAALDVPGLDALEARWPELEARTLTGGALPAGHGRARRANRSWTGGLLSLSLAGLVVAGAAGATLAVVTGDPLGRAESTAITAPEGASRLADVSAEDPDRGPRWGVRVGRVAPGLACLTVGQLGDGASGVGGRALGLVGLDGRFRTSAVDGAEECAVAPTGDGIVAHGRTFVGTDPAGVTSVLYGMVGPQVKTVVVRYDDGASKRLATDRDGVFVVARRGSLSQGRPSLLTGLGQGADEHGHVVRVAPELGRGRMVPFGVAPAGDSRNRGVRERPLDPTEAPR
ncbi:MAG: hypothetical protein PGN13_03005 [Patulibacter minatonensis]